MGFSSVDPKFYVFPGWDGVNPDSLKSFVLQNPNREIKIIYMRGNDQQEHNLYVIPVINKTNNESEIGISMDEIGIVKLPFFSAFWQGLKLNWSMTQGTVIGFYALLSNALRGHGSLTGVSGPVGMVGIVGDAYQFGFVYLLSFVALISINLAIINLIPFPALDGGRILFLLIEKIKGSRINPKFANMANMIGFSILILLMLLITYHDVVKLF